MKECRLSITLKMIEERKLSVHFGKIAGLGFVGYLRNGKTSVLGMKD